MFRHGLQQNLPNCNYGVNYCSIVNHIYHRGINQCGRRIQQHYLQNEADPCKTIESTMLDQCVVESSSHALLKDSRLSI